VGQPGNRELAARISELGLTTVELAAALNDAIEDITGQPGRATDRYVRLLVAGRIRWPWPAQRQALEMALGLPAAQLGFTPRAAHSEADILLAAPATRRLTVRGGDDVDRRELLAAPSGEPLAVTIPALPRHGRLGISDIDRQRRTLTQLIGIDDQLGGVALAGIAARQAHRLLGALDRYEKSDQIERAVYLLAGEYLAAAGWFAVDADELDAAGRYLDQALRAASIARDVMLQAQIANTMAMRARCAGDFAEAHCVAKAALASTAARRNPRVAALFHARVAHGHAVRGETGRTARSLGRAADALARVAPETPIPDWLRFMDTAQFAALAAIAYNLLRQYDKAEAAALEDLRLMPSGYLRNRAHGMLHLVEARLGQGEVEQAGCDAGRALDMASQVRGGARYGRLGARLQELRTAFSYWPDVPAARAWLDAYDTSHVRQNGRS